MSSKIRKLPIPPDGWELMRCAAEVQGDDVESWARICLALSCAKHLNRNPAELLSAFGEQLPEAERDDA